MSQQVGVPARQTPLVPAPPRRSSSKFAAGRAGHDLGEQRGDGASARPSAGRCGDPVDQRVPVGRTSSWITSAGWLDPALPASASNLDHAAARGERQVVAGQQLAEPSEPSTLHQHVRRCQDSVPVPVLQPGLAGDADASSRMRALAARRTVSPVPPQRSASARSSPPAPARVQPPRRLQGAPGFTAAPSTSWPPLLPISPPAPASPGKRWTDVIGGNWSA